MIRNKPGDFVLRNVRITAARKDYALDRGSVCPVNLDREKRLVTTVTRVGVL